MILRLLETTSREQQKACSQAENFRKIELLVGSESDSKLTGDKSRQQQNTCREAENLKK